MRRSDWIDLTGQRSGRLKILRPVGDLSSQEVGWLCRCDCGTERIVRGQHLRTGKSKSCGCLQREQLSHRKKKHGLSHTRLARILRSIISRCENPNSQSYAAYGGRGIKVCERWKQGEGGLSGIECFVADMGERLSPKQSIDRIENNGHYEPGNCRWATPKQQNRNTRGNRRIEYNGETLCITEWALRYGVSIQCISRRLKSGWTLESALTTPARAYAAYRDTLIEADFLLTQRREGLE